MKADEISNITAESGVIASLVHHPEFIFYSEDLLPNHFTDKQNACMYLAISALAHQGIETVDAYNIISALESSESTKRYAEALPIDELQEFLENSADIARHTVEDYKLIVGNVLDAAMRRDVMKRLRECEDLCLREGQENLEQKIYSIVDEVMMEYSSTTDVPQYREVVKSMWEKIKARRVNGMGGIPFKFPSLNEYVTIEPTELVLFAADAKVGKSMMLLNCAVDLLRQDKKVLYIDSELSTEVFTCRILSHLSGVEFKRVKNGNYTPEEEARIDQCVAWLETRDFTHIYMPMFDAQSIYTTVKKVYHTQGVDVLIVDYFKDKSDGDAYATYQELGRLADMVKNNICGDMNIAGLAAAQATSTGKIAGSAKIGRNVSTVIMVLDKTPEEIEADGPECGNKKLFVKMNRNGMQMAEGEYIDLLFDGNRISYTEAKQHIPQTPY